METRIFNAPDITCDHCERVIRRALGAVPGVRQVEVDIPTRVIRVVYDERRVEVAALEAILAREGYPVDGRAAETSEEQGGGSCCGSCHL